MKSKRDTEKKNKKKNKKKKILRDRDKEKEEENVEKEHTDARRITLNTYAHEQIKVAFEHERE